MLRSRETHHSAEPFIIKLEPDEKSLTQLNNLINKKKVLNEQQVIDYLEDKLVKCENKLRFANVRIDKFKIKYIKEAIIRKEQLKTIKSLQKKNRDLELKFVESNVVIERLEKECLNLKNSKRNQDNQTSNKKQIEHNVISKPKPNCEILRKDQTQTNNTFENLMESIGLKNTQQQLNHTNQVIEERNSSLSVEIISIDKNKETNNKKDRDASLNINLYQINKLKLERKLEFDVWYKTLKGYLSRTKLNKAQTDEYDLLDKSILKWLKSKGVEKTRLKGAFKTRFGYSIRRVCSDTSCKGLWNLKVQISDEFAQVYYNQKCNHF